MVWFVIPAFNEEEAVSGVLKEIKSVCSFDYSVLLVDDGSQDRTSSVATSFALEEKIPIEIIRHKRNKGLGEAIKTGLSFCRLNPEDLLVTLDCDGTHPVKLVPKMIEKLEDADIVIASRFLPYASVQGVPAFRSFLSRVASLSLRIFRADVTDWTSGFRAYRGSVIKKIAPQIISKGFTVQVEILLRAMRLKVRIKEIPLNLDYRLRRGKSKLNLAKEMFNYLVFFARFFV